MFPPVKRKAVPGEAPFYDTESAVHGSLVRCSSTVSGRWLNLTIGNAKMGATAFGLTSGRVFSFFDR